MLNPNRKPYPTKDGYVCVMVYTDRHWQSFAVALGELSFPGRSTLRKYGGALG